MELYDSLTAAISSRSPDDKRRIYKVDAVAKVAPTAEVQFVIATSPATAALAVVGVENVSLVTQRELYDATRQALHETIEAHNLKVAGKGAKA